MTICKFICDITLFIRRIAEEKRIREHNATTVIQRKYRKYLRRMYGAALSNAFLADRFYKYKAAVTINKVARGRLGRRIARTKAAVRIH